MSEQNKLAEEAAAGVSVGGGAIGDTSNPPVSKAAQKKIVKKNKDGSYGLVKRYDPLR